MTSQDTHTATLTTSIHAKGSALLKWGRQSLNFWRLQLQKTSPAQQANTKPCDDKFYPSAEEGLAARQELERMFLRRI